VAAVDPGRDTAGAGLVLLRTVGSLHYRLPDCSLLTGPPFQMRFCCDVSQKRFRLTTSCRQPRWCYHQSFSLHEPALPGLFSPPLSAAVLTNACRERTFPTQSGVAVCDRVSTPGRVFCARSVAGRRAARLPFALPSGEALSPSRPDPVSSRSASSSSPWSAPAAAAGGGAMLASQRRPQRHAAEHELKSRRGARRSTPR